MKIGMLAHVGRSVFLVFCVVASVLAAAPARATTPLVPLARPGPWSGVSGLIGYGARLWFVNSVKFVDHNSADVWSYDPRTGTTRYERHLFSQDAGDPAVAGGLLYWPFEDPRFSTGRGEYMVTDGHEWQWRVLPRGQVFHVHAMAEHESALYAATGAWRAGLQRSGDGGASWEVLYDHATPPGAVSRLTTLASHGGALYAGLTAWSEVGPKLLRLEDAGLHPLDGWPDGGALRALRSYRGWLYAVNETTKTTAVWRTDGHATEQIRALDGRRVRALARGDDVLWAVSDDGRGGILWRSADGITWHVEQRFQDARPLDVTVYAGRVYVGTIGPRERGTLWGPPSPAPTDAPTQRVTFPPRPGQSEQPDVAASLERLDKVLADPSSYAEYGTAVRDAVLPLGLSRLPAAGAELARRLDARRPELALPLFGGNVIVSPTKLARWYLLWAVALNGHGRVPPALLNERWTANPNAAEKYLEPMLAAAWAIAEVGQTDRETINALVDRLGQPSHPRWLDGDLIGALTALTGERFGYDATAWRRWWTESPKRADRR